MEGESSVRVRGDSRGRRGRRPRGPRGEASALAGTRGSDTTRAGRTPFLRGESVFPGASPAVGGSGVSRSSCGVRAPRNPGAPCPGGAGPRHIARGWPGRGTEGQGRGGSPLQGPRGRRVPGPSPVPRTCLCARGKKQLGGRGRTAAPLLDSGSSACIPGAAAGGPPRAPDAYPRTVLPARRHGRVRAGPGSEGAVILAVPEPTQADCPATRGCGALPPRGSRGVVAAPPPCPLRVVPGRFRTAAPQTGVPARRHPRDPHLPLRRQQRQRRREGSPAAGHAEPLVFPVTVHTSGFPIPRGIQGYSKHRQRRGDVLRFKGLQDVPPQSPRPPKAPWTALVKCSPCGETALTSLPAGSRSASRSGRTGAPAHRGHPCPGPAGSCGIGTGAAAGWARFCDGATHEQRNNTTLWPSAHPSSPRLLARLGGLRSSQLSSAQPSSAQPSSAQLSPAQLSPAQPSLSAGTCALPGRLSRAGHGARPPPKRPGASRGRKGRTLLSRDGLRTFGRRPAPLSPAVPV
ncbi:collagen alpha-1(III) chain-like [Motacilla alba alba]|uniref:collagen alpha-1(III) chain-like n=1 Tax=Motacilla alba alba TaxID=1094192 RepID=UPI0018D53C41|nr:collagen alpha-1(III) chain-like [Motacilla alba alba]